MIKPGEEWGRRSSATPDLEVTGGDAQLAAAVSERPGVLVRFRPDASSDLAGAVGIQGDGTVGVEVPLDLLRITDDGCAVNMIVIGVPPDASRRFVRRFAANVRVDDRPLFHGPCTTIVIATGQFRRGLDVVPRGHPGDGRAEIQIYAVSNRQRRAVRARLATGTHVPHPDITQRTGAKVRVDLDRRVPVEIDGRPVPKSDLVDVAIVPNAYRLLL